MTYAQKVNRKNVLNNKFQQLSFNNYTTEASASVGNLIWNDSNKNGLQEATETGISGVRVYLISVENSNSISTVSDANGNYEFKNVAPGSYALAFNTPVGFQPSKSNVGLNDEIDSDADEIDGLTYMITLVAGQNARSWDAGFYRAALQPSALSGMAWTDVNGNGQRETTDYVIAGLRVEILDALQQPARDLNENLIGSTTTDANGKYQFLNLKTGTYLIKFTGMVNSQLTAQNKGSDETDSDVNQVSSLTAEIVLPQNTTFQNIDAGFFKPASIGNFVWEDLNGNGIQDLNEKGLENVSINIAGTINSGEAVVRNVTSSNTGQYELDNLKPGRYIVTFSRPSGYQITNQNQGLDSNNSDIDPTTGKSVEISVSSEESIQTIDAGFFKPASVGGFVWEDLNGNGIKELNEKGLSSVSIALTGTTNTGEAYSRSANTNATGQYLLDDLKLGKYKLTFTNPQGYQISPEGQDSDINQTTGKTAELDIVSGQAINDINAGFYKSTSIGDFVWEDMNANGVQDLDEKGLPNVNVTLSGLTTSGEVVTKNTVSNSAGQYLFDGLKPGKYMLVFTSPQGYQVTTQGQGGDTKNSDINQTTNRTAEITLLSGEFINTIDAGFYKFASIGNFVWEDLNANGLQDLNEQGLPNVRVSLTGTTITGENITKNTFSNAEGQYLFENLIPAKYTLTFIKPQEYQISLQGLGADAQNSDISQTTGMTGEIVLISGELKNNIDAGFYKLATIGDFVWEDSNRNGIQDSNEKGLSNVAITLSGTTNTGETITKNMVSNGNGQYLFDKLNPGKYVLTFVSPTSYQITQASLGTDTQNSDINQITGKSSEIVLLSGSINTNLDAGFYVAGLIGDFVWDDLNGNGIQEEDEKGLPNVNINLSGTTNTGEIITKNTTSNSSGQYLFDKLNPGKYTLTFTSPQNYLITQENKGIDTKNSDISRSTGKTIEITLFSGDTKTNIDAGFYKLASIGDFVWDDLNGNGNQDLFDEKGLANVAISLSGTTINGETITKNTISNSSGQYLFDKLDLGKYILTFKSPEGYQITTEGQGINSKNSDISQTTNKTVELTLLSGEFMDNIDAGFYKLATIGNFVWEDKNKNGYQDQFELGIEGATVTIKGMTGSGNNIEEQSITDEKGMYEFKDLEPGTYTIFFQSLKGFKSTAKDFFADDNLDSDADGVSLQTTPFVVISGQIINSIDAGFYRPASISGYAWNDVNQNGIQNKGESPMSNIAINITGNTGDSKTFAKSTTTDVNGKYIFSELDPGFYTIKFTRPISHQTSPKDTGTDDTKDSDVLTDEIAEIIIGSGESRKFDVGFYKPVELGSIRGLIYNDLNRNGLNDDNSFVFQNQVSLLDSADNVLMETQTDAKGIYTFENLVGGKYQVIIKASRGKKITSSNNIDLDLTQSIENLSRYNPDAIVENKTIIVVVNTSRPPKHPTRDVQLMEVGIAPLDIICEPVCIPFFVNKTKKK